MMSFTCGLLLICLVVKVNSNTSSHICIGRNVHCYCDELCGFYNDCCHKFDAGRNASTEPFHCSAQANYFVIDRCSNTSHNDPNYAKNRYLCEDQTVAKTQQNLIYFVPVYVKVNCSYLIFSNIFCAKCNDIDSETTLATVKCLVRQPSSFNYDSMTTGVCPVKDYLFQLPNFTQRTCFENVIHSCSLSNKLEQTRKCLTQPNFYFQWDDTIYRNKYCFFCNTESEPANFTESWPIDQALVANNRKSETLLLDFNQWCFSDCQSALFESHSVSSSNPTIVKEHDSRIERNIFFALRGVSMVSLVFLFVLFYICKEYINIAGKITMCLAISLLFLLFWKSIIALSFVNSRKFCIFLSLMLQYSLISSFIWTSIFAADLYRNMTLIKSRRMRSPEHTARIVSYVSIGFGVPLLFCLSAFVIQLTNPENLLNPGFGYENCFINKLVGGIIWLFAPLCLCLLINVVFCILLYRCLYLNQQSVAVIRKDLFMWKDTFKVCLKISILFGCGWLPEFLGIFLNNTILKYIGTVLANLQGLFLTITLLLSIRMRKVVKQYLTTFSTSIQHGLRRGQISVDNIDKLSN